MGIGADVLGGAFVLPENIADVSRQGFIADTFSTGISNACASVHAYVSFFLSAFTNPHGPIQQVLATHSCC